jgi:hypothetical protein
VGGIETDVVDMVFGPRNVVSSCPIGDL